MAAVDITEHSAHMRRLYGGQQPAKPDAEEMRRRLGELSEPIAAQIIEATRIPTPDRLERLAIGLQAAARLALQLREAQMPEAPPDAAA